METTHIKILRQKLHLAQAQLAQVLGVHSITVARWESGTAKPNDYQAGMLNAFEVASHNEQVVRALGAELITQGAIAAVYLLLNASHGGRAKFLSALAHVGKAEPEAHDRL
jgi:DNA-binding XRE family transcriptional regulator